MHCSIELHKFSKTPKNTKRKIGELNPKSMSLPGQTSICSSVAIGLKSLGTVLYFYGSAPTECNRTPRVSAREWGCSEPAVLRDCDVTALLWEQTLGSALEIERTRGDAASSISSSRCAVFPAECEWCAWPCVNLKDEEAQEGVAGWFGQWGAAWLRRVVSTGSGLTGVSTYVSKLPILVLRMWSPFEELTSYAL